MFKKFVWLFIVSLYSQEIEASLSSLYDGIISMENTTKYLNASESCKNDWGFYIDGLINQEIWALKMFDATGKFPSGILQGNIYSFGHYSECLSVKVEKEKTIHGKYCLADVDLLELLPKARNLKYLPGNNKNNQQNNSLKKIIVNELKFNAPIKWAVCVPGTCNATEIKNFVVESLKINISLTDNVCQAKDATSTLSLGAHATIIFFILMFSLVIVATIYDIYLQHTEKASSHNILVAFSAFTNGKNIVQTTDDTDAFKCLNGIKAVSIILVIFAHEYFLAPRGPIADRVDVIQWSYSGISFMFVVAISLNIDMYFVLGGLLRTYTVLMIEDKNVKSSIFYYYLQRFIRLTPALAAVILAHQTLVEHLGSGPLYPTVMQNVMIQPCQKYWWTSLLYIQNYYNTMTMCLPHTWYINVDMQLYLITQLLILPLRKYPMVTIKIITALSILSMSITFLLNWYLEIIMIPLGQDFLFGSIQLYKYMVYYYKASNTRMPSYLFGMILGYFVYQIKRNKTTLKLKKVWVMFFWVIAAFVAFCAIYALHISRTTEYNKFLYSLSNALIRALTSLSVCWFVFACMFNYAGALTAILSMPILQVIGKLSYSMYLVHYTIIAVRFISSKTPYQLTLAQTFYNTSGDILLTILVAFIWSLMFESPVVVLGKILFKRGSVNGRGDKIMINKHSD